jgi:hypothetical protein
MSEEPKPEAPAPQVSFSDILDVMIHQANGTFITPQNVGDHYWKPKQGLVISVDAFRKAGFTKKLPSGITELAITKTEL